jgi:hypothetical protein
MSEYQEADPVTSAALLAVCRLSSSVDYQIAALSSAIEILRESAELENRLSQTGEYAATPSQLMRVKERS